MGGHRTRLWTALVAALLFCSAVAYAGTLLIANDDEPVLIKVTPPDPVEESQFGQEVAVSGNTMLASRYYSEEAVDVFVRSNEGWSHEQKIATNEDPRALAIDEDTLAISLPGEIQVWVRDGGVWQLQSAIADGGDYIGAMSIDGDTLIGGPNVFVRTGDSWTLQQKLDSSHGHAGDDFASAVSVKDDTAVVGALGERAPVRGAGAVYVFERDGGVWTETARLVRSNPAEFDSLGSYVAFDGNQIAATVGGWSSQTGAVCIWERDGSAWKLRQQIVAPDGQPGNLVDFGGDSFGSGIGLSGDTLVAGAPEDDDKGSNSGSLYILKRVGGTWVHQRKITAPDGAAGDYLGAPVAVDDGRVIAGMRLDNSPLLDAGSVYAFDLGFVTPAETTLTVATPYVLVNDSVPDPAGLTAHIAATALNGVVEMQPDGGFTYAPFADWKGTDRFAYTLTDGASTSNSATVTVQAWQPTSLTLAASNRTPSYGGSTILRASLKTLGGSAISGRSVVFEVLSGYRWVSIGTATTGSTGVASRTAPSLTLSKLYRARIPWTSTFGAAGSSRMRVSPHSYVRTPIAPKTMRRSTYYTVYGYLKPRHKAGTYPVRIYKWKKTSSGRWKSYGYVSAKAYNYSSYTKYARKLKLTSRGKWRLRAYAPADSGHTAAWSSGYDYVTVK